MKENIERMGRRMGKVVLRHLAQCRRESIPTAHRLCREGIGLKFESTTHGELHDLQDAGQGTQNQTEKEKSHAHR